MSIQDLIVKYANRYGVDTKLALWIAKCESGFKPDIYGDGGLAYGVYQFHEGTFNLFRDLYGDPSMSYKNTEDTIQLAMVAISKGEGRHWTCYRKYIQ